MIHIVSKAFTEGFYSKPRADIELLREHSEGIIALSACLGGAIPQKILDGDIEEAEEYTLLMKDIFKEGFYLELQRHGIEEQETVNRHLIRMSKKLGVGLVATNDVHYGKKEDARKQEVLMCIQTGTTLADGAHKGFEKQEFYVKSTDEMYELFSDVPEALENTVKIANECNFEFCFDKLFLPAFYPPDNLPPRPGGSEKPAPRALDSVRLFYRQPLFLPQHNGSVYIFGRLDRMSIPIRIFHFRRKVG